MADDYNELKDELFEKLGEAEVAVKASERADTKFPSLVMSELYYGIVCYMKADKELSDGNEEEAVEEMKKAIRHVDQAFDKEKIEKFQTFLSDFEKGKLALSETIAKEQEAKSKGFLRKLGEEALTIVVNVAVAIIILLVVFCFFVYFFFDDYVG